MYVSVKLTDGFGNQMFRLAAAMGYAERWGHTLVFREEPRAANEHANTCLHLRTLFPHIPLLSDPVPWIEYREPPNSTWTYKELPFLPGNVYLVGDFQCWQYLPTSLHLTLRPSLTVPLEEHDWNQTAFVHVRRGDYLHPWNRHHAIPIQDYLRTSLALLEHVPHLFVVSDDIAWCKEAFPRLFPEGRGKWMFVPEEVSDLETMYWMTQCKAGAICANSTFSWWAAWIGRPRVCCMPTPWGLPPLPPAVDIYPTWALVIPCGAKN